MEQLDRRSFLIAVATPLVALGLMVGVAHLSERSLAPAPPIVIEPPIPLPTGASRTQPIPEPSAEPSTAAEPARFAEPPAVVAATAPLAEPAASHASPPEPRAVDDVLPVPKPKLAAKLPERRSARKGRSRLVFAPRPTPAARALQPERPRSQQATEVNYFAAPAAEIGLDR